MPVRKRVLERIAIAVRSTGASQPMPPKSRVATQAIASALNMIVTIIPRMRKTGRNTNERR